MAGYRILGPLGHRAEGDAIDDGTLCRQRSAVPGVLSSVPRRFAPSRDGTRRPEAPVFKDGNSGPHVAFIQTLLNACVTPTPSLRIDGRFELTTRDAVKAFQSAMRMRVDGIVGPATWHQLVQTAAKSQPTSVGSADRIATWSLEQKIAEAVRRVPSKLPGEIRAQFTGFGSIATLGTILAAFIASQFFGVGELIDAALVLVIGTRGAYELMDSLLTAAYATSDADLDKAARELSEVIVTVGIAAFISGISKLTAKSGRPVGQSTSEEMAVRKSPAIPFTTKNEPPLRQSVKASEPVRLSPNISGKISDQMGERGWTRNSIEDAIRKPYTTRASLNKANGSPATAYFINDTHYVVVDDITHDIIQVSDRNDSSWTPDSAIVNPPKKKL